jgi:hypothetical protein
MKRAVASVKTAGFGRRGCGAAAWSRNPRLWPRGVRLCTDGQSARRLNQAAQRCGAGLRKGLGLVFVANDFDVVSIRTSDESCIIVRVVVRAQTRSTIVFATCLQSRPIESFDLLAIFRRERQVKMRRLLLGLIQAQ